MILVLNLKTNLYKDGIIKYEKMIHDKEVIVLPQYPYLLLFRNGTYQLGSQDVSKFKEGSYGFVFTVPPGFTRPSLQLEHPDKLTLFRIDNDLIEIARIVTLVIQPAVGEERCLN